MTNGVDARVWPSDFIDIVQAVGIQNVFELADVRPAPMERRFSKQTRSITRIANCSHPGWRSFRQIERAIVPDAGVVRVMSGCERNSRWNADRRIGHAIGKTDAVARDPIDVRS